MTRADTAGSYMDYHQNENLPTPLTAMSGEHLIQARQTNTQTSATAAVTARTSVCGYYSGASCKYLVHRPNLATSWLTLCSLGARKLQQKRILHLE